MKMRDTVRIWSWVDAPRRYRSLHLTRMGPGNFRRALAIRERLIAVTIGKEIARLRKAAGLSQLALAHRLSISAPLISYLEHGLRPMPVSLLWDIAEVLGVEPLHFVNIAGRAIKARR